MCGRARCSLSREEVRSAARVSQWQNEDDYSPSFNAAPGKAMPVLKQGQYPELSTMKWGLVPSYTKAEEKPNFFRMFNARSETVASKGVFKKLLNHQRCIVFTNGFYEWKQEGKQKQPYFVHFEGQEVMRMAGLFDVWKGPEDVKMHSFTILTTDSSERLQWLHDRMPVILPTESAAQAWLEGDESAVVEAMRSLCKPYNEENLQWFAVDTKMSNMKNDGADCCRPLKRKSISTFFKRLLQINFSCGSTLLKLEELAEEAKVKKEDQSLPQTEPISDTEVPHGDSEALRDGDIKAEPDSGDAGQAKGLGHSESLHAPDGAQLAAEDIKRDPDIAAEPSSDQGGVGPSTETSAVSPPSAKAKQAHQPPSTPPSGKRQAPKAASPGSTKRQKPESGKKGTITAFFAKNSA